MPPNGAIHINVALGVTDVSIPPYQRPFLLQAATSVSPIVWEMVGAIKMVGTILRNVTGISVTAVKKRVAKMLHGTRDTSAVLMMTTSVWIQR
jgi:hypothetical protein